MNHMRILNPSDENSILITAEFYEDGHRLKTDRHRPHRYELDLIVPDDITLDELLDGIWSGICTQLKERYQISVEDMTANPAYHETILRFEQMQQRYAEQPRDFFRSRPRRRPLHFRYHGAVSAAARYNAGLPEAGPLPGEEDLWRWLVCMDVFHRCREQYLQDYPEYLDNTTRLMFRHKAYPKHPVIACGNISSRNWSDESIRSLAKHIQIWLRPGMHGSLTLREMGFFSSSRLIFDPNSHHTATPWFDALELVSPADEQFPLYNTSERNDIRTVSHMVRIDDPGPLLTPPLQSAFLAIGALLVCALTLVPAVVLAPFLGFIPDSLHMPLFYCCLLAALGAGWFSYRRLCSWQRQRNYRHYEKYIRDLVQQLQIMKSEDTKFLSERYLPVYAVKDANDLVERTFRVDGSISSRRPDHKDFLHVRIGTSAEGSRTVPAPVQFQFQDHSSVFSPIRYKNLRNARGLPFRLIPPDEGDEVMLPNDGTSGFLNGLAEGIRDAYSWLDHAPVLMDLHHARAMGVYFQDSECSLYPLMNNMIFDLCYNHSPDELQFVMFAPRISGIRQQQTFIRQFKQLPHFNRLLPDQSQFVFDQQYADQVMDRLYHLYTLRQADPMTAPRCHIVLLILEDYFLRYHPLAQLLPRSASEIESENNSLTFLYFTHFENRLPPYCSHILKLDASHRLHYIPHTQKFTPAEASGDPEEECGYRIIPDDYASCLRIPGAACEHDRIFQAFKILSALRHHGTGQTSLPRQISLYRLLELSHPDLPADNWFHAPHGCTQEEWKDLLDSRLSAFTEKQWALTDQSTQLRAPIGISSQGPLWLDLDQMPHILISSDPEMGKTESLITILQSLCLHHSSQSIQLFLADPRSGGILESLSGLPHTALTLSGAVPGDLPASIQRLLQNLSAEIQQRRASFNLLGVSNILDYNRALLDLERHIRQTMMLDPDRHQQLIERLRSLKRMPRLILAADHVEQIADLLRSSGLGQAVHQQLLQLLPVAAVHGIHVILAADQPQSTLPADLWPWFQGRLCLHTEDPHLSRQMLRSLAACPPSMPGGGRSWLYSESTGDAVYAQIALSRNINAGLGTSFQITLMEPGGPYLPFYDSECPGTAYRYHFNSARGTSYRNTAKKEPSKRYILKKRKTKRSGDSNNQTRKDPGKDPSRRSWVPSDRTAYRQHTDPDRQGSVPNDQQKGAPVNPSASRHAVPNDTIHTEPGTAAKVPNDTPLGTRP